MKRHLPILLKFFRYLCSGSSAALADIGSYFVMLHSDVWYIAASVISGIIGFTTAFLLHKYVVYRKHDAFLEHLGRFSVVYAVNISVITLFLYVLVNTGGMDPGLAKFVAVAPAALWNFFVYKWVVYV